MTAAATATAEVARVLVDAGAHLDSVAAPVAGGVPGGSALRHAAVFGFTEVVDLLAHAGARIRSLPEAAAAGDITGWLTDATPTDDRACWSWPPTMSDSASSTSCWRPGRRSTPAIGPGAARRCGSPPKNGRVAAVRHLLAHGADPNIRDREHVRTPLERCRRSRERRADRRADDQVEAMLAPTTAA